MNSLMAFCEICKSRHAIGYHAALCWCGFRHWPNEMHRGFISDWPTDWRDRVPVEQWQLYGVEQPPPAAPEVVAAKAPQTVKPAPTKRKGDVARDFRADDLRALMHNQLMEEP